MMGRSQIDVGRGRDSSSKKNWHEMSKGSNGRHTNTPKRQATICRDASGAREQELQVIHY